MLVRNLEPKQGRIREEHDLWNEKWIIAHVRRTLINKRPTPEEYIYKTMSDEVYQAFQNILKHRRKQKNLVIDGYSVFLFINRNGNPQVAVNYEAVFRKLVDKYNSKHEEPLPKITPHGRVIIRTS